MDPASPTPALWLHFDDAEVAAVRHVGSDLCLRFSAAVLRRDASAVEPAAAGHGEGVELWLRAAGDAALPPALFGRLSGGRVRVDGAWHSRLPLPWAVRAAVRLELDFANRSRLGVDGRGIEARFGGPANFRESLAC